MPHYRPLSSAGSLTHTARLALILAEAMLHALVDMRTMTTQQALEIVSPGEEIKTEVAALSGESDSRMHESLELLKHRNQY